MRLKYIYLGGGLFVGAVAAMIYRGGDDSPQGSGPYLPGPDEEVAKAVAVLMSNLPPADTLDQRTAIRIADRLDEIEELLVRIRDSENAQIQSDINAAKRQIRVIRGIAQGQPSNVPQPPPRQSLQ